LADSTKHRQYLYVHAVESQIVNKRIWLFRFNSYICEKFKAGKDVLDS